MSKEKPKGKELVTLVCANPKCGISFSRERRQVESKKKWGVKNFYCCREHVIPPNLS